MQKVFIITGANRGLGKGFVDILIKNENYYIISISRSQSEEQKAYTLSRFYFLNADLSESTLNEKLQVIKKLIYNKEVFFINNASVIEPITKIENLVEDSIDLTISVNIKSAILITNFILLHSGNQTSTFINISSGAANRPIKNWSLYCASKAFMAMFFNVAKSEYKQHRFFNIDPGVMDTKMQESIRVAEFPDVGDFKNLQYEGKLKSPKDVATGILKRVL
jgi:benzil reductase ((S)-benzoin forming)